MSPSRLPASDRSSTPGRGLGAVGTTRLELEIPSDVDCIESVVEVVRRE